MPWWLRRRHLTCSVSGFWPAPGMTEEKFNALLTRQMSDTQKRAQADYLVITDKGLDDAREQVKMILADVRAKLNA
jgi:dephospho-CoA kinase